VRYTQGTLNHQIDDNHKKDGQLEAMMENQLEHLPNTRNYLSEGPLYKIASFSPYLLYVSNYHPWKDLQLLHQ
jgi:hypothetical protein